MSKLYSKKTKLKNPKNNEDRQYTDHKVYDESEELMPLICVYILGFPLKDKSLLIKRKGQYFNQNDEPLESRDSFIKCLNHDFYAIQIGEIPLEPKTELESVLSVFEQRFLDADKSWLKQYEHVITNELLRKILRKLQLLANDERVAQEIDQEEKGRIFLEHQDREWRKALREKDAVIYQKDEALQQKDQVLQQKEQALQQKDQALQQKVQALQQKDQALQRNEQALQQKDQALQQKDQVLQEKEQALARVKQILMDSGKSEEEIREILEGR